jgi:hypothetical protein
LPVNSSFGRKDEFRDIREFREFREFREWGFQGSTSSEFQQALIDFTTLLRVSRVPLRTPACGDLIR